MFYPWIEEGHESLSEEDPRLLTDKKDQQEPPSEIATKVNKLNNK
jgi:hypothetical protein